MPVVPVPAPTLVALQHGWFCPPQAVQTPDVDWAEQ
jgi:hypothetical protein